MQEIILFGQCSYVLTVAMNVACSSYQVWMFGYPPYPTENTTYALDFKQAVPFPILLRC